MTNNNFEFKSYTPTPTDKYMLGIAKVKLYGKIVINFKHVKTKDESSTFFCTNSYTLIDAGGEKKYLSCVKITDSDDEEDLMQYLRHSVNQVIAQRSAHQAQPIAQPGAYYPHGMAQQKATDFPYPQAEYGANASLARLSSEVAKQDELPF